MEKQQILTKLIGSDGGLNFTQEIADITSKSYQSKTASSAVAPRNSLEPWELAYVRQVLLSKVLFLYSLMLKQFARVSGLHFVHELTLKIINLG